jgi:hypothetical protein
MADRRWRVSPNLSAVPDSCKTRVVPDKSLAQVAEAIMSSWGPETMYATDEPSRNPGSRSRSQCGTTALVLQDWLGGKVLVADAFRDDKRVGVHYWNRLPSGEEVDLTCDQFLPNESVGEGVEIQRPPDAAWKDHPGYGPYLVLKERVTALLAATQH